MTTQTTPLVDATGLNTLFELERWKDVVNHSAPLLAAADNVDVYVQVIHAHWALDACKSALALIRKGRSHWPTEIRFCYYAGMVALALGLIKQAEQEGLKALALDPQWAPAYGLLGRVALLQTDSAGAQSWLVQALALDPNNAFYHYLHAAVTWDLGDTEEGQVSLTQALALEPTNSDYLAMQAIFFMKDDRKKAVKLLRQSLRVNPQHERRQKSLKGLTTLWTLDAVLAFSGVALTVLAQTLPWGSGHGWLVVLVNLFIGLRLLAPTRRAMFVAFCLLNAACWGWDNPVGLPALWRAQGPSALWSLETLAYLAGTGVIAFGVALMIQLTKWFAVDSLLVAYAFLRETWQACRSGLLAAFALDVCQRRGVQFNLAAALATALCVVPPINLAMSLLLLVLVLPIVVWLLGAWLLPAAARPAPSVVFMLLGFTLMLATFLFTSYTKLDLSRPDYALQSLWSLAVGFYALMLVNQLRRL